MMPFVPFVRVPNVDRGDRAGEEVRARLPPHGDPPLARTSAMTKMGQAMDSTLFVVNGPSTAGLGLGGEGYSEFSIATPTGEGVTTPLTFCRQRRTAIVGGMRFV